jgi:hypothetical protein
MAQLGGKDLRDFQNLPRTPIGSYIRKAIDARRPAATGRGTPILEQYPALKLYNPRAWSDWIKFYVKNRLGPRHLFNYYNSTDRGVYPLVGLKEGVVRIALTGDWGTGTDEARRVGEMMAAATPDFTIHLGDIYYVGTLAEVNERFLGVDNPHNDYTPCTWPLGGVGSFALSGNHEMYGLGDAYYELLLPSLGLWDPRIRQQAAFFCLENEHWRVVGLDTAYNSIGWPFIEKFTTQNSRLEDRLVEWLRTDVALGDTSDRRAIVLFSHHQYYSAFDEWYLKPAQQLAEFIDRPVLWFWGHEHRMALYGLHAFRGGVPAYGRCLGHGGMPVDRHDPSRKLPHPECPVVFTDTRRFPDDEDLDVGYNGFAVLTFEGPRLGVEYRDLTGATIYTEQWRADPVSGSPVPVAGST